MNHGSIIFLVALLVFGVTLNGVWATDHTASFLDLDYAMWSNHTFALGHVGQFIPNSVDIFEYRGEYYSALAPGLALFAFPFVVPGFIIDGHFSEYGAATLFSEFFVAMMNALAVLYLYKLGRMYFREATASFIALAYAFSTISWPFATFFFQSDASAAFDVIAVYFVLRATRGSWDFAVLIGGLSVAAAMMVDYVNFLLVPVLLVYIVVSLRKDHGLLVKAAAGFSLCSLLGVLAIGLYNFASFGQIIVSSEQLYLHSSSILGDFSTPLYLGVVLNLFTPFRGIFLYSPVLLVGVFGFIWMLRRSSTVRGEGLLILAAFMVLFLPYCAWYGPTGGLSFGPRFIIASFPFLLLPAGYVIEGSWRYRGPVVYILYSVGVVINSLAALTSTLAGGSDWLTSPFLDSTIPLFAQGTLDQWWMRFVGGFWPVAAATVIAAALLLPDILGRASGNGPDSAEQLPHHSLPR